MVAAAFSYAPMGMNRRRMMGDERTSYTTPPQGVRDTQATDGAKVIPLRGAMMGVANDISEALARARMPGNHRAFLEVVRRESQGRAGWQRNAGQTEPGAACQFDLAAWAQVLAWDRSYVRRVRDRLVADHVLWFTADEQTLGRGEIGVNLTFSEWLPLDREHTSALYRRPGAGHPRKPVQQPSIDTGIDHQASMDYRNGEATKHGLPEWVTPSEHGLPEWECPIPLSTVACLKPATSLAPDEPLRKKKEEDTERRETDAIASGVTATPHTAAAPVVSSDEPSSRRRTPATKAAPRKLSDEALAANRAKALYTNAVLAAFQTVLHAHQLPRVGQQRAGAHWFYTAGPDGTPITPEAVMEWYRLTKRLPFWRGKFLSLMSLQSPFTEHAGDLDTYRATIEGAQGDGNATTRRRAGYERTDTTPTPDEPNPDDEAEWERARERNRANIASVMASREIEAQRLADIRAASAAPAATAASMQRLQ